MANTRNEGTSNRGFASMDPDEQREIASRGGRAAHASGNAHEFTSEEARRAGARSHINDDNRRGRNRDDDDDDDRRGRSSSSSTRKRDRYGRFTSD
ncbi:hypothetical protein G0030_06950 [Acinetobacter indicus]|nr:hypothetical protein G0030_06950 [Acinetobacter indicus]